MSTLLCLEMASAPRVEEVLGLGARRWIGSDAS